MNRIVEPTCDLDSSMREYSSEKEIIYKGRLKNIRCNTVKRTNLNIQFNYGTEH